MAADILEGREILTSRLKNQLGVLVNSVEIAGQNNLSSSHVVAETTLAGLLNLVYGWELVNANAIRQNCPGVDLIDEDRKIAVQVTSTRTVEKVRHTLEEAGKSGVIYKRLIILTITNAAPTDGMKNCTVPTYSGPMEVWNISDVFRVAKELDAIRLGELTKYMEAELGPIRERVKELPHLELPPVSALPPTAFVGREPELAEIQSRFARGDRQVFLTGLGGMGKTELAAHYGMDHPGLVYFVRFDTGFTRTLSGMVHGVRPKLQEEELRLEESILVKKVLTLLERSGPDDLLIIDNVDSDTATLSELQQDPSYQAILKLPLKLLMTTRSDVPRAVSVEAMPDKTLFRIFQKHGADLSKQEMTDLIRAVSGHTLTVDLMARTLNGKGWRKVTAEKMLSTLRESSLRDQKYRKIATDYNQSTDQAQIYGHLSVVFDLSDMPELSRRVLGFATLLPEGGMEGECFGMSLPEEEQDALDALLDHGWLEMKDDLLTIHPVIRLVCRTEQELTEGDCEAFLDKLWEQYDRTQYLPDRYTQMAELFALAHDRLGTRHGRWLNRSGILLNNIDSQQKLYDLYHSRLPALEEALPENSTDLATSYNYYGISLGQLGLYSDALTYSQKALDIRRAELPENDADLATSYNDVGSALEYLGRFKEALEYKRKAMDILKQQLPLEHPDLATSYNNVGLTYGNLGNDHKELEYLLKALAIREKVLPREHPHLANSYNNMGLTYGNLGNHHKALEYHLKALAILEKVLPPEHPHLATSYNNVGCTYGDLGNHHKELEYHLKALAIREKVLPPKHPLLATSYNNVGNTYGCLGSHQTALEYLLKALAIREKVLPQEHPDLASSYNSVGNTYGYLGSHQTALEYLLKALAIREKVLPREHPHLATSYNNVGCTYGKLGSHHKALEYHLKALGILEKVLPQEHPHLATSYDNVGSTYGYLGSHHKALDYHLKALAIREKVLPQEHPDLANSYNNVGCTYGNLGNHHKELEYQLKALAIHEKVLPQAHPHLATSYNNIAWTYHDMGDFVKAAPYMQRAAEIIKCSDLPKTHPDRVNYPKWAAELEKKAEMQRKLLAHPIEPSLPPFPFGKK